MATQHVPLIPRRFFPRHGVGSLSELAKYDLRPRRNRRFSCGFAFYPLVMRHPARYLHGRMQPERFVLMNAATCPRAMGGLL